ncbi:hypothetical protein GGR54DRAFT_634669 [Hypoxylon sp. NC1633]|nr:hypothetical protein GGR54DRAFT_634669 [Hypoxylon sp. NC1633]
MAEQLSTYDEVDHSKMQFGDWETLSVHEADTTRISGDSSFRSSLEEVDRPRSSPEEDGYQAPDSPTLGSSSQTGIDMKNVPAGSKDRPYRVDRDEVEATEKCKITVSPQRTSLSSASGSVTSLSTEEPARAPSPRSPASPTNTSAPDILKPGVRFSDRGLPRSSMKRPAVSRRGSACGVPVAEWGVLFDEKGYATVRNGQFLKGLAKHVIDEFAPNSNSLVVTPEKLGVLYSRYRLDAEVYPFLEIFTSRARDAHDRIADFYTDIDCQYHLVQADAYSRPRVPGLTPVGFAQYMTTCILAYPDEEFRRLGKIVAGVQLFAMPDPSSSSSSAPASTVGAAAAAGGSGPGEIQPEKLPRQLLRSQFPVKHDPKSRKILAAALDDLMYDLRLRSLPSPKVPLALMPPPPSPTASTAASPEKRRAIVRAWSYAHPEKPYARTADLRGPISVDAEASKGRAQHPPAITSQKDGDERGSATAETRTNEREPERPLSRYTPADEQSTYQPASTSTPPRPTDHRSISSSALSFPRPPQAGPIPPTPTSSSARPPPRVYQYAESPNQSQGKSTVSGSGSTAAYSPTGTYRRVPSPTPRTYRASAPDVRATAEYLQASASTATTAASAAAAAEVIRRRERERERGEEAGRNWDWDWDREKGAERRGGRLEAAGSGDGRASGSTSMALVRSGGSSGGGGGSGTMASKTPAPGPSSSHHQQNPNNSSSGNSSRRPDPLAPTTALTSPGERKHYSHSRSHSYHHSQSQSQSHGHGHHHRRRRSAAVTIDHDERGPTWEEVLRSQPARERQGTGTGGSGKGTSGGGGHHYRHHSGHY